MGVHSPFPKKLKSEAKKAAKILHDFTFPTASTGPDKLIPAGLFLSCRGIAIITVFKAGFLLTARGGSGIVISKLKGGEWSAPSAIGLAGLGGGFEIGAEVTDFVIILNKQTAVDAFAKGGNLTLGGNVTVAVGPLGRNLEGDVSLRSPAAIYTYSQTKGLFAGISLEGAALIERKDANKKFYGSEIRAHEILSGSVEPPEECEPLYKALRQHVKAGMEAFGQMAKKEARKKGKEAVGMAKLNVMNSLRKDSAGAQHFSSNEMRRSSFQADTSDHADSKQWKRSSSKSANTSPSDSPIIREKPTSSRNSFHNKNSDSKWLEPSGSKGYNPSLSGFPSANKRSYSPTENLRGGDVVDSQNVSTSSWKNSFKKNKQPTIQTKNSKKTSSIPDLTNNNAWDEPLVCVAQKPFTAILPCDLTFSANDRITVLTRTDTQFDWWEGELRGRIGIFPANYVTVL